VRDPVYDGEVPMESAEDWQQSLYPDSILVKFWSRAVVGEPDECWEWIAGRYSHGEYGTFYVGHGRHEGAHRFAYTAEVGPIPAGMEVCHRCDVPLCVNPRHLFVATHAENMHDMSVKGRNSKPGVWGTACWQAKLNDDLVREIRARYANGEGSQRVLGLEYGVTQTLIGMVVRRTVWKHVA
jgi:hypothetical protein